MHLADVPLWLMLAGLAAYAVLGGADFGAGFWALRERDPELREHAHHAMGPVWEANHVWLIFVLVVCWTAYPTVFGSIASTLAIPLFIAAVGIILRGTAYALRTGTATARELAGVDFVFSLASILTPFAFGTAIGAIASGRVPVGNAAGHRFDSWLNQTSVLIGALAIVTAAYLAAVYLAGDAARAGKSEVARIFRRRALGMGVLSGAVALGGIAVVHGDAHRLFDGLTHGGGLAAVLVSGLAGTVTLALVWSSRFEAARATSALAVSAIVAGWALAQRPELLPGLTVEQAAAGRSTLWAVVIAAAIGAVVLVPSLVLLYGLLLRGRFDIEPAEPSPAGAVRPAASSARLCASALGLFGVGSILAVFANPAWALALGIFCLLAAVVCGFLAFAVPVEPEPDL
jgi:cytochrome d ubiquinol oxidase subunit II